MAITDEEFERANRKAQSRLAKAPTAIGAIYDRRVSRVVITLSTGYAVMFSPHIVQELEHAKPDQLDEIEITPSGLGIHFPKIDADIYLPALLEGALGSKSWMVRQMGAKGGQAATPAKVAAAQSNGKLGGRPKKTAVNA